VHADVPSKRRIAGAIKHANVGEQDGAHGVPPHSFSVYARGCASDVT
jgi:hypothetical protein